MSTLTRYPHETGNIDDYSGPRPTRESDVVTWRSPRLAKITRLRLVTDPGCPFFDISYCWGVLRTGEAVWVRLPFHQLDRARWKSQIVNHARNQGVFAVRLGIFDAVSILY